MCVKYATCFLVFTLPFAAAIASDNSGPTAHRNGKPDVNAPAPRVNGHPDLSGVWEAERSSRDEMAKVLGSAFVYDQVDLADVGKYYVDVLWGLKPQEEPLTPEGAAILKSRANLPNPTARCLPAGVPGGQFILAFRIIQAARDLVILPDSGDPPRQIYADGRGLPADPQPSWAGTSVAKWQGDTLAIETTGFTEDSWLDAFGHPRSEKMLIRESYRRRDFGHMDLDVRIEDPKYYTRPFGFKAQLHLLPDATVGEYICGENEKDRVHMARQ